jgi:uronate dehydrogenase
MITMMEAARAAGVEAIIFASTMHVLGMHPRTMPLNEDSPVAPDSRYGVSKAFGEALCRLYAHKYHMAVTVLRIGHVVHDIVDAAPGQGIAAEDMNRIFLLALSFRTPGYRLFHAVAPHEGYPLSDGRLTREGFLFRQQGPGRAEIIARLERSPRLNAVARDHHGGDFVQYD